MSDLTTLTQVGSRQEYQNEELIDADEQNDNEELIRVALNVVIAALNDGTVVQTGRAFTFTAQQTFNAGIKTNAIAPLVAGQNTIYDGTSGSDLYRDSVTANNKYQVGSDVDARIAAAGNITLPLTLNSIQSSDFNAVSTNLYPIDASSNAVTATLPASPANGTLIGFSDFKGTANTNTITIARNGKNIMDLAEDLVLNVKYNPVYLIYISSQNGWYLV